MADDVTYWEVHGYDSDRKGWRKCLTCENKNDAMEHYELLESMYKDTPHKVVEVKVRKEVIFINGYDPDEVVR